MLKPLDHYWYSTNLISLLLLPLAGLFCVISLLRSRLYKLGLLRSYRAPVPVIIIGNISVGGTGKTPLIIELVRQLQSRGRKPGVISRGYGGKASSWPQSVTQASDPVMVGDEPCLIQQRTGCPLVVGPDRQSDIKLLLEKAECDIILSDDGMQHYALQRDIEIAVIDAQRGFGNGFCLPSGPLREPVSRLKSVDLVLLNGGNEAQAAFSMRPTLCHSLSGSDPVKLETFIGKTVHAVAGIGNPERFFSMLSAQGINVIPHRFADHNTYQKQDIIFRDRHPVLMTEKDAVKCQSFELPWHWSVPVEITLTAVAQQQINQLFDSLNSQGV